MHKLALGALFAQPPQPVLADGAGMGRLGHRLLRLEVEGRGLHVAVRARCAAGTGLVGDDMVGAELAVGVEAEGELRLEEGLDGQVGVLKELAWIGLHLDLRHGSDCMHRRESVEREQTNEWRFKLKSRHAEAVEKPPLGHSQRSLPTCSSLSCRSLALDTRARMSVHESYVLYVAPDAYPLVAQSHDKPETVSVSRQSNSISIQRPSLPPYTRIPKLTTGTYIHSWCSSTRPCRPGTRHLRLVWHHQPPQVSVRPRLHPARIPLPQLTPSSPLAADYLIVITKRTKVATVLGSAVYAASDFSVFPIDRSANNADLVKNPEESYLLGLVKSHLYSAPFYFTYGGYNVTTRLQEQQPPPAGADGDNHSVASKPFWQAVGLCLISGPFSSPPRPQVVDHPALRHAGGRPFLLEPPPARSPHQRHHRRRAPRREFSPFTGLGERGGAGRAWLSALQIRENFCRIRD